MRWLKYWSLSFSIIPSKEILGLMSFRMDWLDLLAVKGTLKSLVQHHSLKASILQHSASFPNIRYIHKPESPQNTSLCSSAGNFSIPDSYQQLICFLFVCFLSLQFHFCKQFIEIKSCDTQYFVFIFLFNIDLFMHLRVILIYLNSSLCVLIFNCINHSLISHVPVEGIGNQK